MGDDPGCLNAVSENMPGFIGSHREAVGKVPDPGQVQTRSSDFGLETTMGDAVDFQYDENESKESGHGYRKLSAGDVLARNFGPPKDKPPPVARVETPGDLQRVENLDHGRSQHQQSSSISVPQQTCRPSAVADSSVETTKDLDVVESILESFLSTSEGHRGTSVPSSPVDSSVETATDPESIMENVDCRRTQCSSSSSFSKGTSRPSSTVKKSKDLQRMARLDHVRTQCSSSVSVSEGTSRPSSVFVDPSAEPMLDSHKKAPSFLSASEGHLGTSIPSSFVETSRDLRRWDHRKTPYIFSFGFSKGAFRPSSVVDRRVETSKDLQRLDSPDRIRTQYSSCISVSDGSSVSRPSVVDRDLDKVKSRLENLDHKMVPSFLSTSEEHLGTSRPTSLADRRVETSKDLPRLDRIRTQYSSCVSVSKGTCSEETTKDLARVESILEDLEHRRSVEKPRNQSSVGREVNSELPDFLSSVKSEDLEPFASDGSLDSASRHVDKVGSMLQTMDLRSAGLHQTLSSSDEFPDVESEDPEPSDGEPRVETNCSAESCQSKEHIYCTVYCIANDNYRRPSESTLTLGHGSPSLLDVPGGSDEEIGHYPEAYTLSDLVDPMMFNSVLNVDELPLTCRVCLEIRPIRPLHCCKKAVCEECLKVFIGSQVLSGRADIVCPIPECSGYLEESVVVAHLASEDVAKYKYFLELSRLDSGTKACPRCSLFTSLKGRNHPAPAKIEQKYKIECSMCQLVWCFKCHAPWHEGLKCRDYKKGDKLLRHWASVIEHGQRNAQKCPRCRIHIQRTEGCDHMTCTQCNTNFCYRCGGRYRQLRFFGDHTSNLSVFGCKYRYLPDKPHLRRLIRGSVCVSKVLVAPVLIVLVVVVGALALVVGLFAFPIYCICKKRKKHSNGTGRWLC